MGRIISLIAAGLLLAGGESVGQNVSYPASTQGGFYTHNYYFGPAPSSTPWAPAWSPDGTKIAVAMSGSIWIVDPSSGGARELTYSRKYHSMPAWSPDGRWIVYVVDDGGRTMQLEIVEVETGKSQPLTADDQVYMDPAFSPDGTRLVYVATKLKGNFNVFIRAFENGRFAGDEIAVTRDNDFGRERLYFGSMDMHIAPTWMPDGKELLLVSNRNVPLGSGNVLRVPAAANGIDQATTVLAEQTLFRTRPHVSLDGKRFIYSSTRGAADQFNNLYVQPTTGGEPYKMTFFQHDAFHPRWSPDAEWIAFISNEGGLPQLQLLETYGGALKKVPITERRWKRPMAVVSGTTIDATTGQRTAARIHLKASDGKMYAPEDAYARVTGASDRIFHQAGTFRVDVPVGPVTIEAVKGFEYTPAKSTVQALDGKVVQIDLKLQPLANLSARGWYNGSTHLHMNYAGNLHNTPANLIMMSAAEDQDMVNDQVANKDNRILDYQHFIPGGKPHPISTPDRLLVVGQEYRPAFYGHVFMFQLRDHLISPFTTGYEGTGIESLYPSNTDMLRKAKAQGATVGYVHAFGGSKDPLSANLGGGKGYIVDAALRTTDALEWSYANTGSFYPWYATLNNGLRVTAVGGEDSISSMHASKLVGSVRTYVHTGDRGLDADAWFEGVRNGRAFVSTGPLVELTINDRMPGEDVRLPPAGGEVSVVARVQSITPLESVTLVWNGEVVEKIPLSADRKGAQLTKKLKVARSGWYHLRAEGNPQERYPLDADFAQAFTNPVWVMVGDQPVRSAAAATYCLNWIDKLQQMAQAWPGWRSQQEKDHVYAQFDEARAVYRKFRDEAATTSSQLIEPGNRDCADCPEMAVVPAGEFQMGSPDREEGRSTNENSLHSVTFAKPFAIGKYEVTFDEWDACVAAQACRAVADDGWGRGRRPVIYVNFEMAMGYAKWLTQKTGKQYRVPSEAEWEYAARGGSTTRWFWGEDSKRACEFANVGDDSVKQEHPDWPRHDCNDGYAKTAPVGSFKPNGFGLHDTVGNVWEWVEDCYNPSYEGAPTDGRAWVTGDCVRRLVRGGGWYNKPEAVRSALRYAGDDPARRNNTLGFRVVRTLP